MKRFRMVALVLLAGALVWGGYCGWRAHKNLVTLNVRNLDVRKVVAKIEWQTWERIIVNQGVNGQVTLNVKRVPLDEVLNIIALQTSSRWTALYPIYRARKSAQAFNQVVQGTLPAAAHGWGNLEKVPTWQRNGLGGFLQTARSENKLVSAQFVAKDLGFASLALSRFSRALVVPEDSAVGTINLKLDQVPFEKAVAQVARQVHRKWDQIYALQPMNSMAKRIKPVLKSSDTNAPVVTMIPEPSTNKYAREIEAFLATMSPEEKKKTQEKINALQQLQTLPPAERQQRMQDMSAQSAQASQMDLQQRIQMRLKNGTVDQRVAKDREKLGKQRDPAP
jgi:hypothetical protein